MQGNFGARNATGLSACLSEGRVPLHTHLSYEGLFNELRYSVGSKTEKVVDLHHGYARFQFNQSKFDSSINDYLALFLKGKTDGQPRDENRILNSVICLDISGSMKSGMKGYDYRCQNQKKRIDLSKEAIKMFISKLRPTDSVGMTTFDDKAHLIFQSTLKKDLNEDIYDKVDQIQANGQNTLIDGFNLSKQLLLKQMGKQDKDKLYENRVIILSDVCDNSIYQGIPEIKTAASQEGIHLTIIGVSSDFDSKACELLKDTEGFNYFCAVSDQDILKYLFQTFDYAFFPAANDLTLVLSSPDVSAVQIFGTPDADTQKHVPYQQEITTHGNSFFLTRIKSVFPSEIQIEHGNVYTIGGMILVKLNRSSKGSSFKGTIRLSYKDIEGNPHSQVYDLSYQFHSQEQFFSDDVLREAISAFVYTSELKTIMKECQQLSSGQIYQKYNEMLCSLRQLCPKSKLKDYQNLLKIIKKSRSPAEDRDEMDPSETQLPRAKP